MAFIEKLLGNREEAEDLTHSLFLTLWDDRRDAIRINSMDAYLFRMARNAVMNRIRSRSRDLNYRRLQDITPDTPDTDADTSSEIQDAKLMAAIKQLPEPQQSVVLMSKFKGMSYEQISKRLNISTHTVHYHMSRALRTLRRTIGALLL